MHHNKLEKPHGRVMTVVFTVPCEKKNQIRARPVARRHRALEDF